MYNALLVASTSFHSFSCLASAHFPDCMTSRTTQITFFQFLETSHFCQFTASSYMTDLVTWWIAHGSLSRATLIFFLLGMVSLSWCPTALKLGPAIYFCLLHTLPTSQYTEFCFSFLRAIVIFHFTASS